MSLQIINFQGVPHIVTPYQKGTYIREDAFWRQFRISCSGELSFMEDNPIFGTWQISYGFFLGERGLIGDAMTLAETRIREHSFDLPEDAVGFSPDMIYIRDEQKRLVLAGRTRGSRIDWCRPVSSEQEARDIIKQSSTLHSEGSFQSGWDNFTTARHLHLDADNLEGQLVDPFWREHARVALLSRGQ
ncbi:hypothetical protein Q9314_03255 [Shinella sumterensis]|uniref:Uncharacterized protein n=2 Tax=Rhizobium subbaraonis TaxID=908946 RepID=A0A285USR6_9HYPH|nr:hypothetical protein [Shinella sp.]MCW5711763.1 hypothetical protein [Shinella sp.]WLS08805.1 hypothetical protein Q9314_03255 [Shinella sumterensis]SOC44894.1 hypothetical protein SAMN05892877_113149 [Rhizobium subbaraonis]